MTNLPTPNLTRRRLIVYTSAAAVAWTIVCCWFILHDVTRENQQARNIAVGRARVLVQHYRHWLNATCGRIYITAESTTSTNEPAAGSRPHTATRSGELVVAHPVQLTQKINKVSLAEQEPLVKLDGLGAASRKGDSGEWEQRAKERIRSGEWEAVGEFTSAAGPVTRLIAGVVAEQSCLSCHDQQGTTKASLLGTLSITIPSATIVEDARDHIRGDVLRTTALWLAGVVALSVIHFRAQRRIVERERTHAILREASDRYDRITTTGQIGIWELDAHARTTFVNERMAAMLGYSTDEILGRSMFDFINEEDKTQAMRDFERRRQGIQEQHEFRCRCKDGSTLWTLISTRPIFDELGQFEGTLGIITDITDRKQVEEKLRLSEERLRLLVESTDDIVAMQDLEGRFLYFNGPAARYGVTADDVVGKKPEDLFDPGTAQAMIERIKNVLETGQPLDRQIAVPWRGEQLWFHTRHYPLRDAAGRISAVSMFSRNITVEKDNETRLREAEEKLKLEALRARIAADLHDDLGSTLSGTSIYASMLRQHVPSPDHPSAKLLDRIERNIRDAQESLHEIVWAINPDNDTLEDIVLRIQEYTVEMTDAQGITLHLRVPDVNTPLRVPMQTRRMLFLIFKEAVNNIVRHSRCSEATLEIAIVGSVLSVVISDNGVGFTMGEPSHGNGLVNMQARARSMGGSLEVRSAKGAGTVVALRAPIA